MGLVLEEEKINSILFVFMNKTLLKGNAWHIQVVNFPAQILLTKNQGFEEQNEWATRERWGPNIGFSSVIKHSVLIQKVLSSFLMLFVVCPETLGLTLAAWAAHFPCSRQTESGKNIPCVQWHREACVIIVMIFLQGSAVCFELHVF